MDLERCLTELAERVVIPDAGWLADDVVRRIGEPGRRLRGRRSRRFTAVLAATVALVLLVVLTLSGAHGAVARWLGFASVHIGSNDAPSPIVVPSELNLGPAVSMAEARSRTGLPDPTPSLLGVAPSVHVVEPPKSGQIVLAYPPSTLVPRSPVTGVAALVAVLPAEIQEGFFQKSLGSAATVRSVDVGGALGYWIEGAPHQLFFESDGQFETDSLRLATNTLVWQRGDDVFRIEADVNLDTALRIAASIAG